MILKHRDRELLRFEWTGARGVRVLSANESERKFLPIDMFGSVSDASLWKWISTRTVPRGRKYMLSALRQLGIPSDDIRAIVNFSRGLSLNDVYWIVEDGSTECWKDYITASEIADILSVDARTIERKIRTLRENGRVSRVGSRKAGYWKDN